MRIRGFICVLLLIPVLAYGQSGGGLNTNRPRSSYDPAAAGRQQAAQDGGISSALQKINPCDKDYGAVVQQTQIAAVEQTVEDFYWRSCMVLTVLLILAVMYIAWLWREREIRLRISGDIVSQLYNSHVTSRAKAMEMIEKHNILARRYNAKVEETATAKAEADQKEPTKDGLADAEKLRTKRTKTGDKQPTAGSAIVPEGNAGSGSLSSEATTGQSDVEDANQLRGLLEQAKAQGKANEQKIANLRAQLGRAHHSLEEIRKSSPTVSTVPNGQSGAAS
jgi:hypothetical protein